MSFEDKDVKWEPMTDRQALGLVQYALETDGAPLVRRFGAAGAIALVMAIGSRETLWGAVEDKKGDGFGLMQVLPDSHYWNGLNPWYRIRLMPNPGLSWLTHQIFSPSAVR